MAGDLLRIIHGDKDNLKGNAILFCTLKKGEKKKIIAMYATNDPEMYVQKAGQKKFDALEKICKEKVEGYQRGYAFQFYSMFFDYEKEKINQESTDIVDLGEYNTKEEVETAFMNGMSEYIEQFANSLIKKAEEYFKKPTRFHNNNYHFLSDLNNIERNRYARICHIVEQMTGAMQAGEMEDAVNYKKLELQLRTMDNSQNYQENIEKILEILDDGDLNPETEFFISATIKYLSQDYCRRNKPRFEL